MGRLMERSKVWILLKKYSIKKNYIRSLDLVFKELVSVDEKIREFSTNSWFFPKGTTLNELFHIEHSTSTFSVDTAPASEG